MLLSGYYDVRQTLQEKFDQFLDISASSERNFLNHLLFKRQYNNLQIYCIEFLIT